MWFMYLIIRAQLSNIKGFQLIPSEAAADQGLFFIKSEKIPMRINVLFLESCSGSYLKEGAPYTLRLAAQAPYSQRQIKTSNTNRTPGGSGYWCLGLGHPGEFLRSRWERCETAVETKRCSTALLRILQPGFSSVYPPSHPFSLSLRKKGTSVTPALPITTNSSVGCLPDTQGKGFQQKPPLEWHYQQGPHKGSTPTSNFQYCHSDPVVPLGQVSNVKTVVCYQKKKKKKKVWLVCNFFF